MTRVTSVVPPVGMQPAPVRMAQAVYAALVMSPSAARVEAKGDAFVVTNAAGTAVVTYHLPEEPTTSMVVTTLWDGNDGSIFFNDLTVSFIRGIFPALHQQLLSDPKFVDVQGGAADFPTCVQIEAGAQAPLTLKELVKYGNLTVLFPYRPYSNQDYTKEESIYVVKTEKFLREKVTWQMGFTAFSLKESAKLIVLSAYKNPDKYSTHDVIEKGLRALVGGALNTSDCQKGYVKNLEADLLIESLAGTCMYDAYRREKLSPASIAVRSAFLSIGVKVRFKPTDEESELQRTGVSRFR